MKKATIVDRVVCLCVCAVVLSIAALIASGCIYGVVEIWRMMFA